MEHCRQLNSARSIKQLAAHYPAKVIIDQYPVPHSPEIRHYCPLPIKSQLTAAIPRAISRIEAQLAINLDRSHCWPAPAPFQHSLFTATASPCPRRQFPTGGIICTQTARGRVTSPSPSLPNKWRVPNIYSPNQLNHFPGDNGDQRSYKQCTKRLHYQDIEWRDCARTLRPASTEARSGGR